MAEKQRRISGQDAKVETEQVHALEDEVQRLRNELADKEEVKDSSLCCAVSVDVG